MTAACFNAGGCMLQYDRAQTEPPAPDDAPEPEETPHTPLFYELKAWIDQHLDEEDDNQDTSSVHQIQIGEVAGSR